MDIKFLKLSENAQIPFQATSNDAGYDLSSTENYILQPGEKKLFKTDIACSIPQGFYGRIAPRSGLAFKHGIDVLGGVIDSGYRGNIGVILVNFGKEPFEIQKGNRIAQFIIENCHKVDWQEVQSLEELSVSDRNENSFGSSGV